MIEFDNNRLYLEKTPKIVDVVIEAWYSKWRHQYYSAPYVEWNICDQKKKTARA